MQTDRSRIVARKDCRRLRYLNYHYSGNGISPRTNSMHQIAGIHIHNAHAELLANENIDTTLDKQLTLYKGEMEGVDYNIYLEQCAMLEGMIRAFNYQRLPDILSEYNILSIEQEFLYPLSDGINAMLRFDVIVERKADRVMHIIDFKTAANISDDWVKQHEHSDQTLLYVQAAEDIFNRECGGIIYEGLVKGQRRKDTNKSSPFYGNKIQNSPYCYGYMLEDMNGLNVIQTSYTSKKGYRKIRSWETLSPLRWFTDVLIQEHRDSGLFNTLFSPTPPIQPTRDEMFRWRRQTVYNELQFMHQVDEIATIKDEDQRLAMMDMYFEQNKNRCFKYGVDNQCPFTNVCLETWTDPLITDEFVSRIPHHDTEET